MSGKPTVGRRDCGTSPNCGRTASVTLLPAARVRRRPMRTDDRFALDARRRPASVQLPGFRISLKTFEPGQKVVWAASAPGRLCVMMAGEMTETGRARLIRYRPAD